MSLTSILIDSIYTHRTIKWSLPFRFSDHRYVRISYPYQKWYMLLPPHSPVLKIPIKSLLYLVQNLSRDGKSNVRIITLYLFKGLLLVRYELLLKP